MEMGADVALIASLIGDPVRASMLAALVDGRALAAGELAFIGNAAPQTASFHLGKLIVIDPRGAAGQLLPASGGKAGRRDQLCTVAHSPRTARPRKKEWAEPAWTGRSGITWAVRSDWRYLRA